MVSFLVGVVIFVFIIIVALRREKQEKAMEELTTSKEEERQRQKKEQQQREEAEILRKQEEEKQWQDDIRTGKVDLIKAEAFYNAGNVLMSAGKNNEAIVQFTQAISFNPRYKNAYCNRGITYKKVGKINEAIADYNRAISFDNEDLEVFFNKGLALMEKKDFDAARKTFKTVIDKTRFSQPPSFDTTKKILLFINHGLASYNLYVEMSNSGYPSAVKTYCYDAKFSLEEALKLDPNNSEAKRLLAIVRQNIM